MWAGGLTERFYSSYIDEFPDGRRQSAAPVGSYSLVDGYVSVKPIKNLTVLFGIKNILEQISAIHRCTARQLCGGVQRARWRTPCCGTSMSI